MPSPEVLRALLAGLVAGAATALASTVIVLLVLLRDRRWFERVPATSLPLPIAGVLAMNAFLLGWTALGLVLGALLAAAVRARPGAGLGSPNATFTLAVVLVVAGALGGATVVRGRVTWPSLALAAAATLAFGWLLPWLGV